MICCQFIFTPGTYDDEIHRLDSEIDAFARGLNGFIRTESYTIVLTEVLGTYGTEEPPAH